tara:strand:- start:217 stop:657 length:441 start_codon:yes stop_codon:yes gene_type:complete
MPSQIKVDEIKNVAGQYEIKTDTFKGQTTAGSVTVQGEGSATTNLQQGLNKQWIAFNMNGTIGDSFNTTSITDIDAGDFNITITNAYDNIHYAMGVSGTNSSNGNAFVSMQGVTPTTTVYRLCGYLDNGTNLDLSQAKSITAGDLA